MPNQLSGFISLRIHWKLALLAGVFMLPVCAITWMFVQQSLKEIDFAAKETEGVRHIETLRALLIPMASGGATPAPPLLEAATAVHRAANDAMLLGNTVEQAVAAVRGVSGDGAAPRQRALGALRQAIARIGDGSNLILDPDLNSYYCMDLMVVKLPRAAEQAALLLNAAQGLDASGAPDFARMAVARARLSEFEANLTDIENALESALRGDGEQGGLRRTLTEPFARLREAARAYALASDRFISRESGVDRAPGDDAGGAALATPRAATLARLDQAWALTAAELDRLLRQRIQGFYRDLYVRLAVGALILALAGLLALLIAHSISRPAGRLVIAMKGMAGGDLTVEVPGRERDDELGDLARAATEMRDHLRQLALGVRTRADGVNTAALGVTSRVGDQAASAAQMSAAVAQINSTMEELSATSSQIAENSGAVAKIAAAAQEAAEQGNLAMGQLRAKMEEIHLTNRDSLDEILGLGAKSKEIGKVMEIIDALAGQTKLIAFNAALEASGAGESGRRFGVVAAEIRRLADNVTHSTAEIAGVIQHIQAAIQRLIVASEKESGGIAAGLGATTQTSERLDELVRATHHTTHAAQQISLSTQQQKAASEHTLVALREIVAASGHTAASISDIAGLGREMIHLSADLETQINRFHLQE